MDRVDTLIGNDTVFEGKLRVKGTLRIDGTVNGELSVDGHVVIGQTGIVKAELSAGSCHIAGQFDGKLETTGRCHIASSGTLVGHAVVGALVIEDGASFSGTCEMTIKNPTKETKILQKLGAQDVPPIEDTKSSAR